MVVARPWSLGPRITPVEAKAPINATCRIMATTHVMPRPRTTPSTCDRTPGERLIVLDDICTCLPNASSPYPHNKPPAPATQTLAPPTLWPQRRASPDLPNAGHNPPHPTTTQPHSLPHCRSTALLAAWKCPRQPTREPLHKTKPPSPAIGPTISHSDTNHPSPPPTASTTASRCQDRCSGSQSAANGSSASLRRRCRRGPRCGRHWVRRR